MIKETNIKKMNVILDTDTSNECDDQFAIAYLLNSQDKFNVEAITIAPYQHSNNLSKDKGQEESYQEALKICKYFNSDNIVFKGSTDYLQNGYNKTNEAVKRIIDISLKNDKTYIMAIGAITNVALAIIKEPKIIEKIEIIWLGGQNILNKINDDFNFRQDVKAVKTIFKSKVKLIILPCKGVTSNLITSIYELEHNINGKNELCDYLCKKFVNDGKHEIKTRRPLWDISVIAYLINKDWFETIKLNCPNIKDNNSYELNTNNHLITMVTYLNSNEIYNDLFMKLGN